MLDRDPLPQISFTFELNGLRKNLYLKQRKKASAKKSFEGLIEIFKTTK